MRCLEKTGKWHKKTTHRPGWERYAIAPAYAILKKTSGKSFVENIVSYVYNAGHYSFIIWTIVN